MYIQRVRNKLQVCLFVCLFVWSFSCHLRIITSMRACTYIYTLYIFKYVQICNCSLKHILGYNFNEIHFSDKLYASDVTKIKVTANRQTMVEQAVRWIDI